MGKGDIRTRRGKVWRGTTGVTRPRQKSKPIRTVVPSRKAKSLNDLPKVVEETVAKQEVVEVVSPVTEVNHAVAENAAHESASVTVEGAKKPRKTTAKKAPAKKKE